MQRALRHVELIAFTDWNQFEFHTKSNMGISFFSRISFTLRFWLLLFFVFVSFCSTFLTIFDFFSQFFMSFLWSLDFYAENSHSISRNVAVYAFQRRKTIITNFKLWKQWQMRFVNVVFVCVAIPCSLLFFKFSLMNKCVSVYVSVARTLNFIRHIFKHQQVVGTKEEEAKKRTLSSSLPILWLWTLQFMAIQMEICTVQNQKAKMDVKWNLVCLRLSWI